MIHANMLAFIGLGGWEIFLIVAVFLLLFGAKKLPEMARGLGKGIREFKDASRDIKKNMEEESKVEADPAPPAGS